MNCRISETLVRESVYQFVSTIQALYGPLRPQNEDEFVQILNEQEKSGFRGCAGCLDCTHVTWKNCPTALAGQFQGKENECTLLIEAVADTNLKIWHAACVLPGSWNDINILDKTDFIDQILQGKYVFPYQLNGNNYTSAYFLVDGIYPSYECFVQLLTDPSGQKNVHFTERHEAHRKSVEIAFGVLKQKFQILSKPLLYWDKEFIRDVFECCIILHNLIRDYRIEEEEEKLTEDEEERLLINKTAASVLIQAYQKMCLNERFTKLTDQQRYHQLRADLIDHLWDFKGQCN